MSRKRKHRDDKDEPADSAVPPSNMEVDVSKSLHPENPIFEPLTPSLDVLNQINNALTVKTLTQSPLMDGKSLTAPTDR